MKSRTDDFPLDPAEEAYGEEVTTAITDSKSYKKMIGFLQDELRKDSIYKEVVELRKVIGIPEEGLSDRNFSYTSREAEKMHPVLQRILKKLKLPSYADELLEEYLLFGTLSTGRVLAPSTLVVADLKKNVYVPFGNELRGEDSEIYPIAIKVSPYATENDILDFVHKSYKTFIEPIQKEYADRKVKLGKLRKKNEAMLKRNDLVYKTRSKTLKASLKEVGALGGSLDEGSLGKIRSIETKKRKEV